jgi:hypothetical protein
MFPIFIKRIHVCWNYDKCKLDGKREYKWQSTSNDMVEYLQKWKKCQEYSDIIENITRNGCYSPKILKMYEFIFLKFFSIINMNFITRYYFSRQEESTWHNQWILKKRFFLFLSNWNFRLWWSNLSLIWFLSSSLVLKVKMNFF